jgi:3-isopropylmalate dehydrogenase
MIITRFETARISRFAFDLASQRAGAPADGRSRVTCVDKANILRSYGFFRKIFNEVAREHPGIEPDYAYMDAMACWLVQQPERYDVVVTENMFGDILTDLGAATVGGMGMSPSAEVGDRHGLFQGSHGSAPTIAGKNIANPMATIASGAMMLSWLAQRQGEEALRQAADLIEQAIAQTFEDGVLTSDVGGDASTTGFGDAVVERLQRAAG